MNPGIEKRLVAVRRFVSSHVCTRRLQTKLENAIISFSFDDVPRVTFDYGVPILDKHGCRVSCYVAGGYCSGRADYLSPGQIQTLLDRGHEIGCHTYSHLKTGRCLPGSLGRDLDKNKEYFRRNFSNFHPSNFSYPKGSIGLWNKPMLSKRFTSLRSTCPGINHGSIDLTTLLAYKLYSGRMAPEDIDNLVEMALHKRGWLIFYTHDVSPSPSAFGCTPELLDYAVQAAIVSGASVLSIEEALREMRKPQAPRVQAVESD